MAILWLTGNTGAGKTGLAKILKERIPNVVLLDGDKMRASISVDCGFTKEDRDRHNNRVVLLAKTLSEQGLFVIVSVIAPFQETRERLSKLAEIHWIYVAGGTTGDLDRPYEIPEPGSNLPMSMVNPRQLGFEQTVNTILGILEINKLVTKPTGKYSMMLGRFQPWHAGHTAMIQQMLRDGCEPVVALRDTVIDKSNPYSANERKAMILKHFPPHVVKVIIIPDIKEIVYGRGVGWNMRRINLDATTESISATDLRAKGER